MKNFLQVAIFSILVIIGFTGYSNFGIPQIKPAPPPQPEKVDLGAMTMEGFVALGEKIYSSKGTCTLCHNSMGRAPMLDKLGENTPKRLADPLYKGEAKDAQAYLLESMVKPSAYVVTGFGKAGSNDTESPMPDVSGGSIALTAVEIQAVVAYMLDSNGMENTVEIPKDAGASAASAPGKESGSARKPYTTAEEIIAANTCGACHKIGRETGELGPDLTRIGSLRDREHLRRALLNPNADITEGFAPDMMPANLGELLYAQELELLVDYLVAQRQDGAKAPVTAPPVAAATTPPPTPVTTATPPAAETAPATAAEPPAAETAPATAATPPAAETAPATTAAPPAAETAPATTATPPAAETAPATTATPPDAETPPVTAATPPAAETPPVTAATPPAAGAAPVTEAAPVTAPSPPGAAAATAVAAAAQQPVMGTEGSGGAAHSVVPVEKLPNDAGNTPDTALPAKDGER